MQYGHWTAWATARAISAFSLSVSAPSANTAPYHSENFFQSSGAPSPMVGKERLNSRSEEHTSELQSHLNLVCRLLLEKKKDNVCSHRRCTEFFSPSRRR